MQEEGKGCLFPAVCLLLRSFADDSVNCAYISPAPPCCRVGWANCPPPLDQTRAHVLWDMGGDLCCLPQAGSHLQWPTAPGRRTFTNLLRGTRMSVPPDSKSDFIFGKQLERRNMYTHEHIPHPVIAEHDNLKQISDGEAHGHTM